MRWTRRASRMFKKGYRARDNPAKVRDGILRCNAEVAVTEPRPFELQADYQPAGDQPAAITALVDGIESGLVHQTLLGVTGSGKSVGYDDPLYLVRRLDDEEHVEIVRAGPFIDRLIESVPGLASGAETERYTCIDAAYLTEAYEPVRGKAALYPVAAFLRHRAPAEMFRLTTSCGRTVTLTADHNLWVLRDGRTTLVRTEEAHASDYLPTPDSIAATEDLRVLDVLPYLADTELSVFAEAAVLEYVESGGRQRVIAGLKARGIAPYAKLHAIRHGVRGSGIKVRDYLYLTAETGGFGGSSLSSEIYVGGKRRACRLPAQLPLAESILALFGYYIAEGNAQERYLIIANRHAVIRARIVKAVGELGIPFGVRASSDYQISSTALTSLMATTCGKSAAGKRLPDFWPRLSDRSLGVLLRGYFDGNGTVSKNGEVTATTASENLASDLAYALKRFGIHARLRRTRKRATNSRHAGGTYVIVTVSGAADVERYAQAVGFDHPDKLARLDARHRRKGDTNVDVVPLMPGDLKILRLGLGLRQKHVARFAHCSRPMISCIESGRRRASRALLARLLDGLAVEAKGNRVADITWWSRWKALRGLCSIRWTRIRRVERIQYEHPYVYDLSVPGPETFFAGSGGVFVHNTFTIANVIQKMQRSTLVLVHNKTLAAQLYGEFKEYFPKNSVEYFVSYYDYYQPEAYVPASDTYIEKDASINEHIEQMRLSATKALLERPDSIIVATVSAIYGLGDPEAYLKMVLHLVRGERVDERQLLRRLADMQYTRNEVDLRPGTFRVRGDVVDIFPAESERDAVRVQFFDEEIESLAYFDPLTGEIKRKVPRLTVFPSTHYVTPRARLLAAIDEIKVELRERLAELRAADKLLEAQRLEQRTLFDLEMINELGYCAGIENYSRYLSGRAPGEPPPCLFDYLPHNSLLVIDESHVTIPQLQGMYRGDRSRKETLVEYGFRLPSALDNRPLRFDEFERVQPQTIYVSATPAQRELGKSGQVVEQVVRPTGLVDPVVEVRPVATQVDDLLSEIRIRAARQERVLVTTLTKRMAEDLTDYFGEHGVKVRYLHSDIETIERVEIIRDLRLAKFDVLVGINLLREGLDLPEVSLVAILDADKEGFLRSEGSLIQTVGRAARNEHGSAILYADRMTGSMERAIAEMNRRRTRQLAYNAEHGIVPKSIHKAVKDIMEGARAVPGGERGAQRKVVRLTPEQAMQQIRKLEQEMFRLARNLEFEKAATVRDEIAALRHATLGADADRLVG